MLKLTIIGSLPFIAALVLVISELNICPDFAYAWCLVPKVISRNFMGSDFTFVHVIHMALECFELEGFLMLVQSSYVLRICLGC